jgi:hypothetical protein
MEVTSMEINGKTYRNLESQVAYLTDVWNNQVALNEMGIKVVGHVDTEAEIPEGAYEYGDAYQVGTETPYTMYVWTRADLSHSDDYWFIVGKFPMPGPKGDTGDSLKVTNINTTTAPDGVTYDSTTGITADFNHAGTTYSDGSIQLTPTTITTPLTFNANDFTPTSADGKVTLDLNHTKLATKYFPVPSGITNIIVGIKGDGAVNYYPVSREVTAWSVVQRDANSSIKGYNLYSVYLVNANNTSSSMSIANLYHTYRGNTYNSLNSGVQAGGKYYVYYSTETAVNSSLHNIFYDRSNPPMNILMTDEELFNSTTYPNKQGIIHLSNYQCPISGLHEYTYTTQIPGYYIVYKITDESNSQDTSSDLWSMNRSIYKMGTEVQPSEM